MKKLTFNLITLLFSGLLLANIMAGGMTDNRHAVPVSARAVQSQGDEAYRVIPVPPDMSAAGALDPDGVFRQLAAGHAAMPQGTSWPSVTTADEPDSTVTEALSTAAVTTVSSAASSSTKAADKTDKTDKKNKTETTAGTAAHDNANPYVVEPNYRSPYYIVVYTGSQSSVVYGKDEAGEYTRIVKAFTCSTGKKNSSPTRKGLYRIRAKYRWRLLVGNVYGQYSSSIGSDYLFHSVPYLKQSVSALDNAEYDKLGSSASHGCIRMCVRDCKWIYDNCPIGTQVNVVWESGPAGAGVPQRKSGAKYSGWDPSDRWAQGNPYFAQDETTTTASATAASKTTSSTTTAPKTTASATAAPKTTASTTAASKTTASTTAASKTTVSTTAASKTASSATAASKTTASTTAVSKTASSTAKSDDESPSPADEPAASE